MIRGWRLNPEWVRFYAERDHDRAQRRLEAMKIRVQQEMMRIEQEARIDRLLKGQPVWQGVIVGDGHDPRTPLMDKFDAESARRKAAWNAK